MKLAEECDKVLSLQKAIINGACISLSSWTPDMDTLSSEWFRPKTRWVTFFGIPYHLLIFKVMELLCSRFRAFIEFTKYGPVIDGLNGVRVKVTNCDVRYVSQFVPLLDLRGAIYPIKIVHEVSDGCADEESL